MSNNSFKNLQNKLTQLKNELSTNEPDRRADAIKYLLVLEKLVKESYLPESTSDYMFIKTLSDSKFNGLLDSYKFSNMNSSSSSS